jgi:hypothetical protein
MAACLEPKLLTPAEVAEGDWTRPLSRKLPPIPEDCGRVSTIFSTRFARASRYP